MKSKPINSHLLRIDQQLETSLVFLENHVLFLKTVGAKTPDAILKKIFLKMASDVDSSYKRLSSYHRRRSSQIETNQEYPVSAEHYKLWELLRKHYIFQKPATGKAFGLRVVSTAEAAEKAIQFNLMGIAYFRICSAHTHKTFRRLTSAIETSLTNIAADLSDLASASR